MDRLTALATGREHTISLGFTDPNRLRMTSTGTAIAEQLAVAVGALEGQVLVDGELPEWSRLRVTANREGGVLEVLVRVTGYPTVEACDAARRPPEAEDVEELALVAAELARARFDLEAARTYAGQARHVGALEAALLMAQETDEPAEELAHLLLGLHVMAPDSYHQGTEAARDAAYAEDLQDHYADVRRLEADPSAIDPDVEAAELVGMSMEERRELGGDLLLEHRLQLHALILDSHRPTR